MELSEYIHYADLAYDRIPKSCIPPYSLTDHEYINFIDDKLNRLTFDNSGYEEIPLDYLSIWFNSDLGYSLADKYFNTISEFEDSNLVNIQRNILADAYDINQLHHKSLKLERHKFNKIKFESKVLNLYSVYTLQDYNGLGWFGDDLERVTPDKISSASFNLAIMTFIKCFYSITRKTYKENLNQSYVKYMIDKADELLDFCFDNVNSTTMKRVLSLLPILNLSEFIFFKDAVDLNKIENRIDKFVKSKVQYVGFNYAARLAEEYAKLNWEHRILNIAPSNLKQKYSNMMFVATQQFNVFNTIRNQLYLTRYMYNVPKLHLIDSSENKADWFSAQAASALLKDNFEDDINDSYAVYFIEKQRRYLKDVKTKSILDYNIKDLLFD